MDIEKIEEIAFKDRKTLANLNKLDLLDIIEFLRVDRKEWINQFSKTHNESIEIQKENQELKKHLKVPKTCNLKTLGDYKSYYEDTTREQILEDTYIEYCAYVNLAHRYSELKKQLEDMTLCRDIASGHREEVQDREITLLNQQKEFIKYLEYMLDDENDIFSVVRIKDVLQKYKEIVNSSERN